MHAAADQFGGLVVAIGGGNPCQSCEFENTVVRRVDGPTGDVTWEHVGEWYTHFSEVAIRADGRVFFTETNRWATLTTLVGIEGDTGVVHRWPLPVGHRTRYYNDQLMEDHDTAAVTTGPIIRKDGAVVLVGDHHSLHTVEPGVWWEDGTWHQNGPVDVVASSRSTFFTTLTEDGALAFENVDISALPEAERNYWSPGRHRLMPDGHDGWLLTGGVTTNPSTSTQVHRLDANRVLSPRFDPLNGSYDPVYQADFVVGEDAAWAFFEGRGSQGFWSRAVSFDPATLAVETDTEVGLATPQPKYLQLRSALPGGGIYISGPTDAFAVDASVSAAGFAAGGNASLQSAQMWAGWGSTPALVLGAAIASPAAAWAYVQGGPQRDNAVAATFPNVAVNCRPVSSWYGYFADHCYIEVRIDETNTRYIQSGPENEVPPPYGQNLATDRPTLDAESVNNPRTHYGEPRRVTLAVVQCLQDAVDNWNTANIQYEPLGDNSNYFASWITQECQVKAYPQPLARPLGWRY